MTKKELIDLIEANVRRYQTASEYADMINKKDSIKNLLQFANDEAELGMLSSAEELRKESQKVTPISTEAPPSAEAIKAILGNVEAEIRTFVQRLRDKKKQEAVLGFRQSKKPLVIGVMCFLSVCAVSAVVFGILGIVRGGVFEHVSDIIGIVDCVFGILFFTYELYDDKVKTSGIENGDAELIAKYTNARDVRLIHGNRFGKGSVVINGDVKSTEIDVEKLFRNGK